MLRFAFMRSMHSRICVGWSMGVRVRSVAGMVDLILVAEGHSYRGLMRSRDKCEVMDRWMFEGVRLYVGVVDTSMAIEDMVWWLAVCSEECLGFGGSLRFGTRSL